MKIPCAIYRGGTSIEGTIVNEIYRKAQPGNPAAVRIGHPSGTLGLEMEVERENGDIILTKSALARTARLLMDGSVHVPDSVVTA